MSAKYLSWARRVPLRPERYAPVMAQRLVLFMLADNADTAGVAWPAVAGMAETAGASRSTIKAALGALADRGLIEPVGVRSVGGRGNTTRWRLCSKPAVLRPVSSNGDEPETG